MASSRSILALVLTIACCMTAISAEESAESKEFVLTLDHSNFSDTVSKHNFIVVEFYAPWYTFNFSSFYFGSCLQFFFVFVFVGLLHVVWLSVDLNLQIMEICFEENKVCEIIDSCCKVFTFIKISKKKICDYLAQVNILICSFWFSKNI